MKYFLVLTFGILLLSVSLSAQEEQKFEFDYTIESLAFKDERAITVYLPPSYYKYPEDKFTVTYVLDGHFDPFIDLAAKTIEYNTYMYKYTPTIVVGIHAKQRGWEFSAPVEGNDEDANYQGGRAPELQQHFKNEVFPLIDSVYADKILSFRNLIGHSSGGAFVLYSLFSDEKDLFDGYLAISPAIRDDSQYIFDNATERLKSGEQFRKFLYCSSGTVGEREELFGGAVKQLDSILAVYPDHGLIWRTSQFEGMGHWTCVPPSFNSGMVELTRAFRVDEKMYFDFASNEDASMKSQIEEFYRNRQEEYGFTEIPPGGYLTRIAWELIDKEKYEDAMGIYDWGIDQYPKHYSLAKAKAKLLFKLGKMNEALAGFEKALTNLEGVKDKMPEEDYQEKASYLLEKMEECKKNK
ncbi:MAG: alpha/beta hydrolase-fold protein [Saprospiraceae bacterium]|nr:alpha/beta hydrolase-fold protein [Saprospiraceae bacterium]